MQIEIVVKTKEKVPQKLRAYLEYNAADMKENIQPLVELAGEAVTMMLSFIIIDDSGNTTAAGTKEIE